MVDPASIPSSPMRHAVRIRLMAADARLFRQTMAQWEADGEPFLVKSSSGSSGTGNAENLIRGLIGMESDQPSTGWVRMEAHRIGRGPVWEFEVAAEMDDLILKFSDGSISRYHPPGPPLDDGPRLLEPISVRELTAVEGILSVLWEALGTEDLTDVQRGQIMAMADLIRAEQVASAPEVTPRWRLVGVVRGALRYLVKEAPRDALAWWKLADLLQAIDWHHVVTNIPL